MNKNDRAMIDRSIDFLVPKIDMVKLWPKLIEKRVFNPDDVNVPRWEVRRFLLLFHIVFKLIMHCTKKDKLLSCPTLFPSIDSNFEYELLSNNESSTPKQNFPNKIRLVFLETSVRSSRKILQIVFSYFPPLKKKKRIFFFRWRFWKNELCK